MVQIALRFHWRASENRQDLSQSPGAWKLNIQGVDGTMGQKKKKKTLQ